MDGILQEQLCETKFINGKKLECTFIFGREWFSILLLSELI